MLRTRVLLLGLLLIGGCSSVPERMSIDDYEPRFQVLEVPKASNSLLSGSVNPFSSNVAARVGDVITIVFDESMTATKKNSSTSSKDSEVSISPVSLLGVPVTTAGLGGQDVSAELASGNSFKGAAGAAQSNSMRGSVAVTVHRVYPNGNVFVKGEKWIQINTGDEFVQVAGVVRVQDISADNTVPSSKLADARIVYSSEGQMKESNEPGLLFRVLNNSWWPF